METNAFAYVSLKLSASWLAMRLDMLSLIIITGVRGSVCGWEGGRMGEKMLLQVVCVCVRACVCVCV